VDLREEDAANFDYAPDQAQLLDEALRLRQAEKLLPSQADQQKTHLLLIDLQKDFCFPQGSLYVAGRSGRGAIDDNLRIARFIRRNLGRITEITATLDSHLAFQIFSPSFWVDSNGLSLTAHREVTAAQVRSGEAVPNPALGWLGSPQELRASALHYCESLERAGKYQLWLWPPHCIQGSAGHALAGVIHEARLLHSYARSAQSWVVPKGDHPLTENYSVFAPEVLVGHSGNALAPRNPAFLEKLLQADRILVAGQASSHCVKSSIEDLLGEIRARDPALARKVYLLTDCMSAVTVPDGKGGLAADFTPQAEAALEQFARAGMHLVRSTDTMETWPRR